MDRRKFIQTGIAGVAGLSLVRTGLANIQMTVPSDISVDRVKLGKTGLKVSRIAMGTGTKGWNYQSNQTRLGLDNFVKIARHGYERGIRFFDMADMYGSQPFVGKALKELPREKLTLMTKGDWAETRKFYMDGLAKAKQDGIVKAVGVSCHNWEALVEAVDNPWCDVILARLNPFQSHMDGTVEAVNELLGKARKKGKGLIGMKIFGEGKHVSDAERERSIRFAVTESNLHCMTLGLESIAQMNDAIERVMRNARG